MFHFIDKVTQLEDEVSKLQKTIKNDKEEWTEDSKKYKEKEKKKVNTFLQLFFNILQCFYLASFIVVVGEMN